jgi:hypothetical protein
MSPLSDLVAFLSGRRSEMPRELRRPLPAIEPLESRRLLSVSPLAVSAAPISLGPSPLGVPMGQGVTLHEVAGVPFTASVGTFLAPPPGAGLNAFIRWGDGITSRGIIKPDGLVSVTQAKFEVDGSHTYRRPRNYGINVVVYQPGPTATTPTKLIATIKSSAVVIGRNVALDGTIKGTYKLAPTAFSLGGGYVFDGTGTAGDLGDVTAHGFAVLPGPGPTPIPIPYPNFVGTLTLTSTGPTASPVNNSVTLVLSAPSPLVAGASFPTTLHYAISNGTGMFLGATGTGTIAVTLNPDMTFSFVITSNPPPTV